MTLTKVLAFGLVFAASILWIRPAEAGLMDWFRATTKRATVAPDVAQNQIKKYLERVLKREDFQIGQGRSILSAADRKPLDEHILSRVDRFPELAVADVTARGAKGIAILAGQGLSKGAWDPVKGYVAYVSLRVEQPFPTVADRALEIAGQLVGEPGMFGFSVEAGPLWRVTERFLVGSLPGADARAQLMPNDSVEAEAPGSGSDDIPAWVVRGWTELVWKGQTKPLEMGALVAITRERGDRTCRVLHVTGVGPIPKGIFAGGIRLNKDDDDT